MPESKRLVKIVCLLIVAAAFVVVNIHVPLFSNDANHYYTLYGPPVDEIIRRKRTGNERQNAGNITNTDAISDHHAVESFNEGCFVARNDTVPTSRYGELSPPFINLGFPKIGSSSIHSFFACAGYRAMHYRCRAEYTCAECVRMSVTEGLPPFAKCGKADVYSQIDDGSWGHFSQIEYLDEIIRAFPNGTFFLTFRSMERWYHSMTHWPPVNDGVGDAHMSDGLRRANITGFPPGTGRNVEEFGRWFCNHVKRVRDVISNNPQQTLVEIDIEDPTVSARMSDVFDVDEKCWGHANVNKRLHPELDANRTRADPPWFVRGRTCIRGKAEMRLRHPEPPPVIPGLPHWLFIDNRTCDNETIS